MGKTKSKTKCLKILLLVIAIIVCIFIAIVARRTIILSEIDKKVTELENNSNNFYIKTTFIDENNYTTLIERYIKGDVSKLVMEKTTPEGKNAKISNPAYSMSKRELIVNAIVTSIKTKKIDGKDYYMLSSKMNTNFLYNTNTTKMTIYVEKDTGLTTKIVEDVNENGEIKEIYKDFEYKFNNVTDEDISEPDNSEYKMQENS